MGKMDYINVKTAAMWNNVKNMRKWKWDKMFAKDNSDTSQFSKT
jgi:hypothetical protein